MPVSAGSQRGHGKTLPARSFAAGTWSKRPAASWTKAVFGCASRQCWRMLWLLSKVTHPETGQLERVDLNSVNSNPIQCSYGLHVIADVIPFYIRKVVVKSKKYFVCTYLFTAWYGIQTQIQTQTMAGSAAMVAMQKLCDGLQCFSEVDDTPWRHWCEETSLWSDLVRIGLLEGQLLHKHWPPGRPIVT